MMEGFYLVNGQEKVFTVSGMTRFFKPTHVSAHANREISILIRLWKLGPSKLVHAPVLHEFVKCQRG